MNKRRAKSAPDPAKWARLGRLARSLVDEIDAYAIEEAAAEDIWRSLKKWGTPAHHGNHPIYCTCADCT